MKVLHVISSLRTGGAEKMLVDIIKEQKKLGIDVSVFCTVKTSSKFELMIEKTAPLYFSYSKSPYSLYALTTFLKHLTKHRYEVIHSHLTPAQIFALVASIFLFKKTMFITTEHNTFNRRRLKATLKFIDYIIYMPYKSIICISEATGSALSNWIGSTRGRIEIVHNGIKIGDYSSGDHSARDPDVPKVVSVGRFEEQKDQDTIIKAFAIYGKGTLTFVGDGSRRDYLQAMVKKLNIQDKVFFKGRRDDIPDILASSDIYVQSSHWEGFGLAAVEAMASGLPTIASNIPGLREVVGSAGILVAPAQSLDLVQALISLEDKHYYNSISISCRARSHEFDVKKTAIEYMKIYSRFLT